MGRYPRKWGVAVDRPAAMTRRARDLLAAIGVRHLDVRRPMGELSTAQEQLVQIAAAVGINPRVHRFRRADQFAGRAGRAEPLPAHRAAQDARGDDDLRLAPHARALPAVRPDQRAARRTIRRHAQEGEMTQEAVVRMMIGRERRGLLSPPRHRPGGSDSEAVLRVRGLASPGRFRGVDFEVQRGRDRGFRGVWSARAAARWPGRSSVWIRAREARWRSTADRLPLGSVRTAMRAGVGLVPEDRKRQGCVLGMGCRANVSLAILDRLQTCRACSTGCGRRGSPGVNFEQLRVKAASLDAPVSSLSGGNQQKIVLAKWLARGGRLLIVDEPTRGVDVGAKAAIHALIDRTGAERLGGDAYFVRAARGRRALDPCARDAGRSTGRRTRPCAGDAGCDSAVDGGRGRAGRSVTHIC